MSFGILTQNFNILLLCVSHCSVAPYNVVIMGDNTYDNGDQLELHCSSEGGPDFKYSWNRTNLFSVTTTTNTSTLTISNLTTVDGGDYTCTATNDNGTSMNTITVYGKLRLQSDSVGDHITFVETIQLLFFLFTVKKQVYD